VFSLYITGEEEEGSVPTFCTCCPFCSRCAAKQHRQQRQKNAKVASHVIRRGQGPPIWLPCQCNFASILPDIAGVVAAITESEPSAVYSAFRTLHSAFRWRAWRLAVQFDCSRAFLRLRRVRRREAAPASIFIGTKGAMVGLRVQAQLWMRWIGSAQSMRETLPSRLRASSLGFLSAFGFRPSDFIRPRRRASALWLKFTRVFRVFRGSDVPAFSQSAFPHSALREFVQFA